MLIILIHNDGTGTPLLANYTYEVRINERTISRGEIKGHRRRDGWRKLVDMIPHKKDEDK